MVQLLKNVQWSPYPGPTIVLHCTVGTYPKLGSLEMKGTNTFSGLEGLILGGGGLLVDQLVFLLLLSFPGAPDNGPGPGT